MAIIPETLFPGKSNPGDSDYPHGSARDVTTPGDGLGTPLKKDWLNDLWGFHQALLQKAGITPSGTPDTAQLSQYYQAMMATAGSARKNQIVDGRFDFWYEATSRTGAGYGSATMWWSNSTGLTISQQDATGEDFQTVVPTAKYYLRFSGSSAGINTYIEDSSTFAGQKIVVSLWLRSTENVTIEINAGGDAAAVPSTGGAWQKIEASFQMPVGTGVAGVYFKSETGAQTDIACVQLEEGETATKFEELSPRQAFDDVSRYFYKYGNPSITHEIGVGMSTATTESTVVLSFPEMRGIPIITNSSASTFTLAYKSTTQVPTAIAYFSITPKSALISVTASSLTAGEATRYRVAPSGYIYLDSRL